MYHIRPPLVAPNAPRRNSRLPLNLGRGMAFRYPPDCVRMTIVTGVHDSPRLFVPSPHLCDVVNGRIVLSEIEGGVHLRDVVPGTVLEVRTQNRAYTLEYQGSGQALISGHPV